MTVDTELLSAQLATRLGVPSVRLEPVGVPCKWPVFRGTASGLPAMFVKINERMRAERTVAFLTAVRRTPFLPRCLLDKSFEFADHAVLCLEWKSAQSIRPEEMSDAHFAAFADGCRRLAEAFADYGGPVVPPEEDAPDRQYAALRAYAAQHPFAARFFRSLLSIPEARRSYGRRPLSVIHGDFQCRNFGFKGDRFAAVFDFDALTRGLPCEDAAYAFTERARRAQLSSAARQRLTERFLAFVRQSPWPKDDWLIALNHARLRIASRRVESHPNSPLTGFDIGHRDRPLARLVAALEDDRA